MALTLHITRSNGNIDSKPLTRTLSSVEVMPGDTVRVIDAATGRPADKLRVRQAGRSLWVEGLPDDQSLELSRFFDDCADGRSCVLQLDADSMVTSADVMVAQAVVAPASDAAAGLAGGSAATAGGAAGAVGAAAAGAAALTPATIGGVLLGTVAVGAAAGGGGGGGSDGGGSGGSGGAQQPQGDGGGSNAGGSGGAGISGGAGGTGSAGGTGGVGETGGTGGSGNTGNTGNAGGGADAGSTDGTGHAGQAGSGTGATGTDGEGPGRTDGGSPGASGPDDGGGTGGGATGPVDTLPPASPAVGIVAGDDVVNRVEAGAGVVISGTAEAGSTVTITWGGHTATTRAADDQSWSVTIAEADVPVDGAQVPVRVTATDAAGNVSDETVRAVAIDTMAPGVATAGVDAHGVLSGTLSTAAATVTVSDGTTTLAAVVSADGLGFSVLGQVFAPGQALTIIATDAAGNRSDPHAITVPATPTATSGTDAADTLIGGAGSQVIEGGAGNDILIGGTAGSVRNYQFEYWDLRGAAAGTVLHKDGAGALIVSGAPIGWTIGSTHETYQPVYGREQVMGDPDSRGADLDSHLVGTAFEYGAGTDVRMGHYHWETVAADNTGAGAISQTIVTQAGTTYTLSMDVTNLAQGADQRGTTFEIRWNGELIGRYDGTAHRWVAGGPQNTASGLDQSWNFDVVGRDGATATELEIRTFYDTLYTTDGSQNWHDAYVAHVEQVTLTAQGPVDGDDTLVGGRGNDLLWGQGGNDVLWGDSVDGHHAGSHNVFVYSMREVNGRDTIMDFRPGTDRIAIIDLLDTAGTHSNIDSLKAVADVNGVAPGQPGYIGTYRQPAGTTNHADRNLTADDLTQASSPTQYLSIDSDGGDVRISFVGGGVDRGAVTLRGVAFSEANDSVQELIDQGYLTLTQDGFSERLLTLPSSLSSTVV
ncbi:MAG: Ig-like domain-containing protein [Burkholderiaceae bacterium]